MARKIRFPLKMKNGAEVRTLDELKENFDLESVLGYFTDGKLQTWLADRYYDEKAEAVAALSADMPELNAKLCEILEVEYQAEADETDLELIQRRNEKIRILSAVTADKEILDNIDFVAMNQDELFDILDEDTDKVYLYGERFEIPIGRKYIRYIGMNEPLILLENGRNVLDYEEAKIRFEKTRFEESAVITGEQLFIQGRYREAFPIIEKAAINGDPRSMYLLALYYYWGYNTVIIDLSTRDSWFIKGYECGNPLASYWYARWSVNDNRSEQERIYQGIFEIVKEMADSGDQFAQQTLGSMFENGRGTKKSVDKALKYYTLSSDQGNAWAQSNLAGLCYGTLTIDANSYEVTRDYTESLDLYKKAAEKGYAAAQYCIGDMYFDGKGFTQDYAEAVKWYRKSADQGYAIGQCGLGYMYEKGYGVTQDKSKAIEWYKKAAAQGNETAKNNLKILGCQYDL